MRMKAAKVVMVVLFIILIALATYIGLWVVSGGSF